MLGKCHRGREDLFGKISPSLTAFRSSFTCRGSLEQRSGRYSEAIALFDAIAAKHYSSDYAPRASFMKAFSLLQAERHKDAVAEFEQFEGRYPRHDLAQDALYWRGIGYSLDGQFSRCRQVMDDYLNDLQSRSSSDDRRFSQSLLRAAIQRLSNQHRGA